MFCSLAIGGVLGFGVNVGVGGIGVFIIVGVNVGSGGGLVAVGAGVAVGDSVVGSQLETRSMRETL